MAGSRRCAEPGRAVLPAAAEVLAEVLAAVTAAAAAVLRSLARGGPRRLWGAGSEPSRSQWAPPARGGAARRGVGAPRAREGPFRPPPGARQVSAEGEVCPALGAPAHMLPSDWPDLQASRHPRRQASPRDTDPLRRHTLGGTGTRDPQIHA